MSNINDINAQIAQLQAKADAIKAQDFTKTVQEIINKMDVYSITVSDIESVKGKKPKSVNPVPIKYRGPSGESWSGRGLTPRWLSALVAQGHSKEQYLLA